jgi:predicted lactoylglutathione lyase
LPSLDILEPTQGLLETEPICRYFLRRIINTAQVKAFIVPNFHSDTMTTKIFLNLPVKDLNKTIEFFSKLEFSFDPQFTDENATCMIVGEDIFVMLLVERFFKTFTKKEICDTAKSTEMIVAVSAESREKVDQMIDNVVGAGGREYREPQDHGWMYQRSFEDIDGHIWEIVYMDETK